MFATLDKVYRLRSSVALVEAAGTLEMFKTNVRESTRIKIAYENIIALLSQFDGKRMLREILENHAVDPCDGALLVDFLNSEHVLIEVDCSYHPQIFSEQYRIINLIEDYKRKTSDVVAALDYISSSTILVVGLGAVGTWVGRNLAQSGVRNFILVDNDVIEVSNLHRQDGFFEADVGRKKVDALKDRIGEIADCSVTKIDDVLDDAFFHRHALEFDLAINCADFPSVDYTTELIGEYCMSKRIPHLVGGGYNLHLSLIGQAVLPGQSACVRCFRHSLEKMNQADLDGVKKLHRPNRKIGSFGPLCAVSASVTSSEAFKILIRAYGALVSLNKRIEFRVAANDFSTIDVARNAFCEWCGPDGLFRN